jgi:hypothetical protein
LFVGQAMWYGRDSEGGPLCREEGERVSHQGFIHFCCGSWGHAWDSLSLLFSRFLCFLFFISSWNGSWQFIHLFLNLVESGLQVDCRFFYFFSTFRKKTLKSCQGRRVSWPCFNPYHMYFHQGYIIWGKR